MNVVYELVEYRDSEQDQPVWFWINQDTGIQESPTFETMAEAMDWNQLGSDHN